MRFRLDDLVVDSDRLTVERDGSPVRVEPQVFDVLCYLAEHRDRVVPKEELLDQIWGDRFVSESAVSSRIKSARRLVGDDGVRQCVVKTVHGRGYRWVAEIEVLDRTGDPSSAPVDHRSRSAATSTSPSASSPAFSPTPPPGLHTETLGRDEAVREVVAGLDGGRMVTLIGPPGIGKTRVALEALRRGVDGGGAVCFVELHTATGRDDVVRLVRQALGVDRGATSKVEPTEHGMERSLLDQLADSRILLVLDNCEHVARDVAGFVSALLASAPDVTVLATSRRTLWVDGERLVVVRPLDQPDEDATWSDLGASAAGRLFLERSAAAGTHWEGSDEDAEIVHDICRRLDGVPLAIELAAARTRWMPLDRVLSDVTLSVEGDVARADPLTVSLRASRGLLDDAGRAAFDALAIFAGPFHLDAALAVITAVRPTDDPLTVLQQLVDHSLVDVADPSAGRYRLLAPVRHFAASGDPRPTIAGPALIGYYSELVERTWPFASTVSGGEWDALDASIGNILNLAERAPDIDPAGGRRLVGSLGRYWWTGHAIQRCVAICDRLGEPSGDDPAIAARYLLTWSSCSAVLWQPMPERAQHAYELAVRTEQWQVAAAALSLVVASDPTWADIDEVEAVWDDIESLYRRSGDVAGEAWARVQVLGHAQACAGRSAEAAESFRAAIALFEDIGDHVGVATASVRLAREAVWMGTVDGFDEARAILPDELTSREASISLPHDLHAEAAWFLGRMAEARGDTEHALDELRRSVAISQAHAPGSIATNSWRVHLAAALRRAGETSEAARCLHEACVTVQRSQATTRLEHSTWVLENVAGLLADVDRPEDAATLFGAAEAGREHLGTPMRIWDHPGYDRDVASIPSSTEVTAAWEAGARLELEEACRVATSLCASVSPA